MLSKMLNPFNYNKVAFSFDSFDTNTDIEYVPEPVEVVFFTNQVKKLNEK